MDIILIVILVLCAAGAVTAMLSARKKGRCASCPYNDSCSRRSCKIKGDDFDEGSA